MKRTQEDIQDELLVLRCQDGDAEALTTLIERWHPKLGRFAWRLTGHAEAAKDVVQEAWVAIVRGLPRLQDPARFRSWAYRIVKNRCTDRTRRRVVSRNATDALQSNARSEAQDSANSSSGDDVALLREAMTQLPDEQRAILSLHYLDGMSVAEIGRSLDMPVGTVKSRLFHARNRLRDTLERVKR